MSFKVIITRDFEQMSEVAAGIVTESIAAGLKQKEGFTLGLVTGSSPTGLYKHLAGAANAGVFDPTRIRSFNLDEYVGLPGENAQQRALHYVIDRAGGQKDPRTEGPNPDDGDRDREYL